MTENNTIKISIKTKILRVVLSLLILLAVAMGAASIVIVNRLAKEDATKIVTQACDQETLRFDHKLNMVHHSVAMINEYIVDMNGDDYYEMFSDEYEEAIEDIAISIANQTDGAMAVYYRYNPEITGDGKGGFFWSKLSEREAFVEEPNTDILQYDSDDIEHVGWFYVPKESGKPLWMNPYYNQNLDVFMISYIIPVYSDENEFLGVVGMDIDFNSIMNIAGKIKLYDTGKAELINLSERIIYTSDNNGNTLSEKLADELYDHITTVNSSSDLFSASGRDEKGNAICYKPLTNGMILLVTVPLKEIYANRNNLICTMLLLTIFVVIITIIISSKLTARIVEPINKLAEITSGYANGDWSQNYISNTGDEVQHLSESIAIMSENTQKYMKALDNLAKNDGLTGIKNKTCFLEWVEDIKSNINNAYNEYGVVVMDLNLLKKANDNYGHEAGDALILEASKHICKHFSHSPVFRIGGDEFAVILTRSDYENRVALCEAFEQGMNYEVKDANGIILSIAYGLATSPEDGDDYDTVFKAADERMYLKKKEMKMGRDA